MSKSYLENLKITYHIKGNPRVFDSKNLKDVEDIKAIFRARPPIQIEIDEETGNICNIVSNIV